jgi:hypothetical protein
MTRIVSEDFSELKSFINNYSLSSVCNDTRYIKLLSFIHKRYFSLLVFHSELEKDCYSYVQFAYKFNEQSKTKLANYLKEAISDLGLSLFNWTHGAYKSSRLIMRSSIENIIRALCAIEDPSICEITVTYDLFEEASHLNIFNRASSSPNLSSLKGNYTDLCGDVHTADISRMQHISALGYFPAFDFEKASRTARLFAQVSQRLLIALSLCFREFLFHMHPTNQDSIFHSLPRDIKEEIHNP